MFAPLRVLYKHAERARGTSGLLSACINIDKEEDGEGMSLATTDSASAFRES